MRDEMPDDQKRSFLARVVAPCDTTTTTTTTTTHADGDSTYTHPLHAHVWQNNAYGIYSKAVSYGPFNESTAEVPEAAKTEIDVIVERLNGILAEEHRQAVFTTGGLTELINTLKKPIGEEAAKAQKARRAALTDSLNESNGSTMYRVLRNAGRQNSCVLWDSEASAPTANVNRIHDMVHKMAEGIYNKHAGNLPKYDDYHNICKDFYPTEKPPSGPPPAKMMHQQAQRASPKARGAMDGAMPIELKQLPLEAWERRHEVLSLARRLRRHPKSYYTVSAPLIPKDIKASDDGGAAHGYRTPEDHRILTIFSAIYRVESGATFRQHLPWLKSWIHKALHGCMPERDLSDVSWDAQAECEHAMMMEENLVVMLLDYWKFFDAFEPHWVRDFMLALGLDEDLSHSVADLYCNLIRHIKIRGTYGKPITGTNGLGQGDSLSMMIALMFVSVQFYYLDKFHWNVTKGSCLDDRNIRGEHDDVLNAHRDIKRIDEAAGHFSNPTKLAATATTAEGRSRLREENVGTADAPIPLRVFRVEPLVGDALVTKRSPARALSDKRLANTIDTAHRVDNLPCSTAQKTRATATAVIPKMLKGTQWTLPSKQSLKQLLSAIMKGIWSHYRKMRASEIVMAILNDPTKVDPFGATMYACLSLTRRTLRRCDQRRERFFKDIRIAARTSTSGIQGPAHTMHAILDLLGIDLKCIKGSWISIDEHCVQLDLIEGSNYHFRKTVTMWIRKAIISQLNERCQLPEAYEEGDDKPAGYRKDTAGISPNVDMNATTANFSSKKGSHPYAIDGHLRNSLNTIVTGAVRAGDRLHAAGIKDGRTDEVFSDRCPHCEDARHTTRHMFWFCEKHRKCREAAVQKIHLILNETQQLHGPEAKKLLGDIIDDNAFQHAGICPDDTKALGRHKACIAKDDIFDVIEEEKIPNYMSKILNECTPEANWVQRGDRWYMIVYTDGSTLMPQSYVFARSGFGVYVGEGSPANHAAQLQGASQSTYRAELRAAIHVLKHVATNVIVISDCKSVVDGCNKLLNGEEINKGNDDLDLWALAKELIEISKPLHFTIEWMPSHLSDSGSEGKKKKYLDGGGDAKHIAGNDKADALAKKGAEEHEVCGVRAHLAGAREKLTRIVQNMMVDIWRSELADRFPEKDSKCERIEDDDDDLVLMQNLFEESVAADLQEVIDKASDEAQDLDDFFGAIDIHGEDAPRPIPATSTTTNKDCVDHVQIKDTRTAKDIFEEEVKLIQKMFPEYVYDESDTIVEKITPTSSFNLKNPPKPQLKIVDKQGNTILTPFDACWWDPLEWFFGQLQWSPKRDENGAMIGNTITFIELAVIFEMVTNGRALSQHDLPSLLVPHWCECQRQGEELQGHVRPRQQAR